MGTRTPEERLYEPEYVAALFDRMGASYERVSTLTSFGFNRRWRKALADRLSMRPGMTCADLMCGGGEAWEYLLPRFGVEASFTGIDLSVSMLNRAQFRAKSSISRVHLAREDALATSIASESVDRVYCAYGMKTLAQEQWRRFVTEVHRILKPGGLCGVFEVSLPPKALLRLPYLWYLSHAIPVIGRLALANPDEYRSLGRYVSLFGDCSSLGGLFKDHGFDVQYEPLFFGCATTLIGKKP